MATGTGATEALSILTVPKSPPSFAGGNDVKTTVADVSVS